MITSACATALARLSLTKQSSSGSVDLHGVHFRGWNKYADTYPAKMVLIFAYGAQIRARICAPAHVYARRNEYALTPACTNVQRNQSRGSEFTPYYFRLSLISDQLSSPALLGHSRSAQLCRFAPVAPLSFLSSWSIAQPTDDLIYGDPPRKSSTSEAVGVS